MRLHNLGTVISFEVRRTLGKPTFWAATLAVPLLFVVLFAVSFFSSASAANATDALDDEPVTFTYSDASGIVVPDVATALGGSVAQDPEAAAQAVRDGRADLFIAVPADPTQGLEVIGRDVGLLESTRWDSVAQRLISESATAQIGDPRLTDVIGGVPIHAELWTDGQPSPGWGAVIAPGLFLVLLFMSLVMLGQQMLNITMEEKENRVSEMILTTIDPSVLVIGKVIGVVCLGILQGLILGLPVLVWFLATSGGAGAPTGMDGFSASDIVLDPLTILAAAALFLAGFLMLTGLLVLIGSIMPTAKDASGAYGAVVIAAILPIYTLPLVVASPDAPVSAVLTVFPLTAPVTSLARLAVGSLPVWQGLLAFVLVSATAWLALSTGIRLFREGSIAYGQRLSLSRIFPRSNRH